MSWESQLAGLLFESAVRPLVLWLAALLVLRLFRIAHPASKHAVWTTVLAGFLLLPLMALVAPPLHIALPSGSMEWMEWMGQTERPAAGAQHPAAQVLPEYRTSGNGDPSAAAPAAVAASANLEAESARPTASGTTGPTALWNSFDPSAAAAGVVRLPAVTTILAWCYLAGLVAVAAYRGMGWILWRRLRRRSTPLAMLPLRESADLVVPVTAGLLRPVVILPADWRSWSIKSRRAILAHEFAHIRRRDLWVAMLSRLTTCLLWFHPLAWSVSRRVRDLAEMACDAVALQRVRDPGAYSRLLVDFAARVSASGRRAALPGLAMSGSSGLGRRIDAILALSKGGMRGLRYPRTALAAMLPVILLAASIGFTAPLPQRYAELWAQVMAAERSGTTFPEVDLPATQPASLSGVVLDNATDLPVTGVRVSLLFNDGTLAPSMVTGEDGRFSFPEIRSGRLLLHTNRMGYSPSALTRGTDGIPLTLQPGEGLDGVTVRLIPTGRLSGRILNERGEAIPRVEVVPAQYFYDDVGRLNLERFTITQQSARPDDRGQFQMPLDPGEYLLWISIRGYHNGFFYPGTTDPSRAVPIKIESGIETALDPVFFAASILPAAATIQARVADATGRNLTSAFVRLYPRTGAVPRNYVSSSLSGRIGSTITLPDLLPGIYDVAAYSRIGGSLRWWTESPIRIDVAAGESAVTELTLLPGSRLTARAWALPASGNPFPVSGLQVRLQERLLLGESYDRDVTASSGADGVFSITNVPHGVYIVAVDAGLPSDLYISAVLHGESILTPDRVRIAGDSVDFILVLEEAGRVSGAIAGAGDLVTGADAYGAFVVLAPEDRSQTHRYYMARVDQHGEFGMDSVAPGDYRIYAWSDLQGAAYLNTDFMRRYDGAGLPVRVVAGENIIGGVRLMD